jgi:hypothetical protein
MSRRIPTLVMLALLLVTGCGDDGTAGTGSGDQVVFGEGEPPSAFPADFPIPTNAVIGTTLVDRINHRSEMALQIEGLLDAAVQNFTIGLVSQGYVITSSEGTAESWTIAFERGELQGEVVFQAVGGFTQAVASVNGT